MLNSFIPFILQVRKVESGIVTFLGFWFLSQLIRKGTMLEFRLELAKQLINGFPQ